MPFRGGGGCSWEDVHWGCLHKQAVNIYVNGRKRRSLNVFKAIDSY